MGYGIWPNLCDSLGPEEQDISEQTLGRDDECVSRGDCAANALQLKGGVPPMTLCLAWIPKGM